MKCTPYIPSRIYEDPSKEPSKPIKQNKPNVNHEKKVPEIYYLIIALICSFYIFRLFHLNE